MPYPEQEQEQQQSYCVDILLRAPGENELLDTIDLFEQGSADRIKGLLKEYLDKGRTLMFQPVREKREEEKKEVKFLSEEEIHEMEKRWNEYKKSGSEIKPK